MFFFELTEFIKNFDSFQYIPVMDADYICYVKQLQEHASEQAVGGVKISGFPVSKLYRTKDVNGLYVIYCQRIDSLCSCLELWLYLYTAVVIFLV